MCGRWCQAFSSPVRSTLLVVVLVGTAPWSLNWLASPTTHSSSLWSRPRIQWQATAVFLRAVWRSSLRRVSSPAWVMGVCHVRSPRRSAN